MRPDDFAACLANMRKLDPLFSSAVYATEEAIINAMVAAETMTGRMALLWKPCLIHNCGKY